MHLVICLSDVLKDLQVVEDGVIVVLQIVLDPLTDRLVE